MSDLCACRRLRGMPTKVCAFRPYCERIAELESQQQEITRLREEAEWIRTKEYAPPHDEPVVYARPGRNGKLSVGIAYWTVSEKWTPEAESTQTPSGFPLWKPLPPPPNSGE